MERVTFQNNINLNGAERTVQVDDNPFSGSDYAEITGVISGGSVSGLVKTGPGYLLIAVPRETPFSAT